MALLLTGVDYTVPPRLTPVPLSPGRRTMPARSIMCCRPGFSAVAFMPRSPLFAAVRRRDQSVGGAQISIALKTAFSQAPRHLGLLTEPQVTANRPPLLGNASMVSTGRFSPVATRRLSLVVTLTNVSFMTSSRYPHRCSQFPRSPLALGATSATRDIAIGTATCSATIREVVFAVTHTPGDHRNSLSPNHRVVLSATGASAGVLRDERFTANPLFSPAAPGRPGNYSRRDPTVFDGGHFGRRTCNPDLAATPPLLTALVGIECSRFDAVTSGETIALLTEGAGSA